MRSMQANARADARLIRGRRRVGSAAIVCALLLAAACGDVKPGTGDAVDASIDAPPVGPTPEVTATTPQDGAAAVEPTGVAISATFSIDMDPATINATTFKVRRGNGAVAGQVTYDAATRTATFAAGPLALLGTYTASLTTGATSSGGKPLAADVTWTFRVRDGAWGTAERIETDNAGNAQRPAVAFDAGGNAIAVWHQSDGTRDNVWANRYLAGQGWGTATLIETDNTGPAQFPRVGMDAAGNAIAVWLQSNGTRNRVMASRFVAGTGWSPPSPIDTGMRSAQLPRVAVDPAGNAIAVWYQADDTLNQNNIWTNRYAAGSGWGTPTILDSRGDRAAIAMDASGNAIATWRQYDGTSNNARANRYTAGAGWGTPTTIETEVGEVAVQPEVDLDDAGNAIAVWSQTDGTRNNIWANRFVAGTGWGTAQLIETTDAGTAAFPQVAVNGAGAAVAIWYQTNGTRYSAWANTFTPGGAGWGTATLIETDETGDVTATGIDLDESGNAVAVWGQSDGTRVNAWANRYVAGTGWGTAELIETLNTGPATILEVATSADGPAIAVWWQADPTRLDVWANVFR